MKETNEKDLVMKKVVAVVGTTASGKSDLGLLLAKHYHGEIVSADSRQIYKGLDLGTGKETPEELASVPHHLIDILSPNEPYSVADYQRDAYSAIDGILEREALPFLVGGTGLYLRAVTEGYNLTDVPPDETFREEMAGKTKEELLEILKSYGKEETNPSASPRRLIRRLEMLRQGIDDEIRNKPRYDTLILGMTYPRDILVQRIRERLDRRIELGMVDEVRRLSEEGATDEFLYGLGLEYRYTLLYLRGEFSGFNEYHEKLFTAIRQFSKRQMTWFRKEKNVHWLDVQNDVFEEAKKEIDSFLKQ